MNAVVTLRDLTLAYERKPAVHHLNGSFEEGSLTAIVGPNGAGKSTLLKAMVGLIAPSEGRIERHGLRRHDLAYLPQQAEIDRSFPITVNDTVALGLWRETGIFRAVTRAGWARVAEALAAVGLEGSERNPVGNLSVGQFQRVLFARLIVQDAKLILLDEPFAAIDERTTDDLMKIVSRWHDEGRTVAAVLHDMDDVRTHFPETLLIAREPVAWGPTPEVMTEKNLAHARALARHWNHGHDGHTHMAGGRAA